MVHRKTEKVLVNCMKVLFVHAHIQKVICDVMIIIRFSESLECRNLGRDLSPKRS